MPFFLASLFDRALPGVLFLAQLEDEVVEKSYSASWAIILLCIVLALMISLKPSKREALEAKKRD